jgi:hypothetical protein
VEWDLPEGPSGHIAHWEALNVAVLMDIRDELKKLNALLHCQNFTAIPHTLKTIARNTTKPKPKKGTPRNAG